MIPTLPVHAIEDSAVSVGERFLVGSFEDYGPGAWQRVPHRHAFVEVVWVREGSGIHWIDGVAHAADAGTVHVVAPGGIHHWDPGTVPIAGTLVLFREDFLAGRGGPGARTWTSGGAHPDAEGAARIERLLTELATEASVCDPDRELAMRGLLTAFVVLTSRMLPPASSRPDGLAGRFDDLVRRRPRATLTVAECARHLGVTPGHLSDAVAAATGATAGERIRAEVLHEAQRLLATTELTCAQVAASLAFDDPSYFSRFFRREAGVSPTRFRTETRAA